MPGAGKSTLLAGLPPRPGLVVLDSDDAPRRLRTPLPARLPYRRYRPLVHLVHRLALVRAACSDAPDGRRAPARDRGATRTAVVLLAALTGRTAHLLWLHVDPGEALGGQRDRGRLVPSGSFAGHAAPGRARRAGALRDGASRARQFARTVLTLLGVAGRPGRDSVLDTRTPFE